jgi:hypothetical protein
MAYIIFTTEELKNDIEQSRNRAIRDRDNAEKGIGFHRKGDAAKAEAFAKGQITALTDVLEMIEAVLRTEAKKRENTANHIPMRQLGIRY